MAVSSACPLSPGVHTSELVGADGAAALTFALMLYLVLILWAGVQVALHIVWDRQNCLTLKKTFHAVVFLGTIARIVYYLITLTVGTSTLASFCANRVTISLFFCAFSLIAFYWVDLFHSTTLTRSRLLSRAGPIFIAVNVLYALFQITVMIVYAVQFGAGPTSITALDNADVLLIACTALLIAVVCLVYGLMLYFRMRRTTSTVGTASRLRLRMMRNFVVSAIIITLAMACRFGFYLYRPITNCYISEWAFHLGAYVTAEIVPTALQLVIMKPSRPKSMRYDLAT